MDKESAQKIVYDTFQREFNRERFEFFIKNLFNKIDEKSYKVDKNLIPNLYTKHIDGLEVVGGYNDGESQLDILVVTLKKGFSVEQARTLQRNFVAWYLNGSNGGEMKDAALVAFVSPNETNWRFSLVKMDYKFEENSNHKIKIKQEFTSARRWSFLVGLHENSHTAQSRLVPIIENDENNPSLKQIEGAFNIETVTKEFFEKYRDLFLNTKDSLDVLISNNLILRNDFLEKGIDSSGFVKKLLGQIVFLYFLQKKGWFGVALDKKWGEGDKFFLRTLFEKAVKEGKNYFNDYLEPLFYEALAIKRDHDFYNSFNCKIPFLNGGLFDPINGYDWVNTTIYLSNDLFSNLFKNLKTGDLGNGILDIFDRYNFTVKEDEPLEKEVAIDPEMLGKVFENLLEIKDRRSEGAYYTPRVIVHYMCKQSLLSYLENKTHIDIEKLNTLINFETFFIKKEALTIWEDTAKEIETALSEIYIVDPACGSGAFLVGMMHEILGLKKRLNEIFGEGEDVFDNYQSKLEIIQNNLYGVDLDPSAVEIAKLRLWLSLIVDEEDVAKIKPLPNLDYKIMQGNSLIDQHDGVKILDETLLDATLEDKSIEIVKAKNQLEVIYKKILPFYEQNPKWMKNEMLTRPDDLILLETERKRLDNFLKKNTISYKIDFQSISNKTLFSIKNESEKIREILNVLHKKFFNTSDRDIKNDIKKKVDNLEWELMETTFREQDKIISLEKVKELKRLGVKPFFLWKFHFSEIFEKNNGFDIVIGNPPYISLKKFKGDPIQEAYKQQNYQVYDSNGDIYCLFYEKGMDLLKKEGILSYITSNKWMRAGYGEKLRQYFSELNPLELVDLGANIFEYATVDTNILLIKKAEKNNEKLKAIKLRRKNKEIDFLNIFQNTETYIKANKDPWFIGVEIEHDLKEKIKKVGKPLKDWGIKINYGIKTGFNEAFIINEEKRRELIEKDPKSIEIIKPILRGKDIKKYGYDFKGLYMIIVKYDFNKKLNKYFSILKHLSEYRAELENRGQCKYSRNGEGKGQHHWLELDNNPKDEYLNEFEREKIIYSEIVRSPRFHLDYEKFYIEASGFIMTGNHMKYICGLLNSKLITFIFKHYYAGGGLGEEGYRYKKNFIELLPLPIYNKNLVIALQLEKIVDNILILKKQNKEADTKNLESQIDQLVYKLYDLMPEEIEIVENSLK